MVGKMNNQDVDIMAGTDCPIFFFTPGFSLHKELEYLVESGLTPLQALESATLKPATYFSMETALLTARAVPTCRLPILMLQDTPVFLKHPMVPATMLFLPVLKLIRVVEKIQEILLMISAKTRYSG